MVKFWEEAIATNERLTKARIKHAEEHGLGAIAMEEKARLLKVQKKIKEIKENKLK